MRRQLGRGGTDGGRLASLLLVGCRRAAAYQIQSGIAIGRIAQARDKRNDRIVEPAAQDDREPGGLEVAVAGADESVRLGRLQSSTLPAPYRVLDLVGGPKNAQIDALQRRQRRRCLIAGPRV